MKGADQYGVLELLRQNGIKTAIIQGDADRLNSSERVWKKIGEGSESAWKILTSEDYEKDKEEYDKRGIKPGQKAWNRDAKNETPQFNSIKMTAGGHEIHGPRKMADKILSTLDSLDREISTEEATKFARESQEAARFARTQQDEDNKQLADARQELRHISSENQIQ